MRPLARRARNDALREAGRPRPHPYPLFHLGRAVPRASALRRFAPSRRRMRHGARPVVLRSIRPSRESHGHRARPRYRRIRSRLDPTLRKRRRALRQCARNAARCVHARVSFQPLRHQRAHAVHHENRSGSTTTAHAILEEAAGAFFARASFSRTRLQQGGRFTSTIARSTSPSGNSSPRHSIEASTYARARKRKLVRRRAGADGVRPLARF